MHHLAQHEDILERFTRARTVCGGIFAQMPKRRFLLMHLRAVRRQYVFVTRRLLFAALLISAYLGRLLGTGVAPYSRLISRKSARLGALRGCSLAISVRFCRRTITIRLALPASSRCNDFARLINADCMPAVLILSRDGFYQLGARILLSGDTEAILPICR